MQTLTISLYTLALLIFLALLFDFMNGFHDAANAIATVVSTGVLRPQQAVLFAAFFNVVAIAIFQLKVAATIGNARAFLAVQAEFGSFDQYLWQFVGGRPIQNVRRELKDIPPRTAESDAMSKALLQRGFKFVGSTICYALMQAVGLVNDHCVDCPRWRELGGRR